ncbi:hypothetical protein FGG08_000514 [Glutinoglossum americanum]|uniref:AB hydrolase-1 domain-containing protein n=1 Tax=Glutinoglossum americanum TaxID=1670608 RepID=A0A9P8ID68_9PEZI|nr:hypothetical protein FGG08_000514 [Glutinoglossum americanum]
MIGTSVWEYIFIRSCIFFLHWIAPLSILYCITSYLQVFEPITLRVPLILKAWVVAETAFYFFVYLPLKYYLQGAAIHPKPLSREERRALFLRCHETVPDPEQYLSKWFLGAPASEIKRENVKEFFCWAFLNKGEYDPVEEDELEEYATYMEKLLQRNLEEGRGEAKCLRLTLDDVDMLHRSLTWYLTRLPILFIHGIGIGLYPYINLLAELNTGGASASADGELGILAVEIMPVSFRITSQALDKNKMCGEIQNILKAHGWDKFVLVSHSYGSVISAHLLHTPQIAEKIGPILLIDPVSFLLHHPDVAYNFTRRKPSRANEHQLYYFASKDMGVSHTLARRFFWSENILWKEDFRKRRLTVSLGGKDLIVDTEAVGAYLTEADKESQETGSWKERAWEGEGLDLLWFRNLDHAQVFDREITRRQLVEVVRTYCEQG